MENNWLNVLKLLKRILILTETVYQLKNQKNIFNELVEEKFYEFQDLREKINPNNLIYKCKSEERSPKDFSNYQNLIDLFIILKDGTGSLREKLSLNQI